MSRRYIFVLIIFGFFFGVKFAKAEVIINEVQLNPTDGRFIELYNSGDSSVNLTDYYIQRKTQTGSTFGSLVSKTYFENKTIDAGGYFLISRGTMSNADIVYGSLTLTESNTIQIKNADGNVVDSIGWGSCGGTCVADNPSDGQSIQKISGSWIISSPTPKAQNTNSGNNPPEDNNSDTDTTPPTPTTTSTTSSAPKLKVVINPTIKAKILTKTVAFAGLPLDIENSVIGYYNEKIRCGRYFWNFGDGDSKETTSSEEFSHTYFYPGEYTISLDYYLSSSFLNDDSDASDKILVKVLPLAVSISNVGDEKDFFIELTNNSDQEANISKWELTSSNRIFIFPKNTTIPAKGKTILSPKITGFTIADKNNLKLLTSAGDVAFDYNSSSNLITVAKKVSTEKNNPIENTTVPEVQTSDENLSENLPASPILSDQNIGNSKYSNLLWIGLFFLLGIGASTVYFVRRKRNVFKSENNGDFEILDE